MNDYQYHKFIPALAAASIAMPPRPAVFGRASPGPDARSPLFARPGAGPFYDGRGRAYSRFPARNEGPRK